MIEMRLPLRYVGILVVLLIIGLTTTFVVTAETPTPNETSTTPLIETPTPEPTFTPAQLACEQFDWAVWEAWWGTIAQDPDEDANSQYHSELTKDLLARLSWVMALKDTEPAMERMISPLYWTLRSEAENLNFTFRSGYDRMVIGARQMERMCFARGYEKQFDVLPDVLAEYACVDHIFVNSAQQVGPSLQHIYWDCELTDNDDQHTHNFLDATDHTHRELHQHSGY